MPTIVSSKQQEKQKIALLKYADLTVIIPAYNEAKTIQDTVISIQNQTVQPKEILVVDDCSSDNTADIARALGVRVIQAPYNTGSKAGAQTYALPFVDTFYTCALDADTTLAQDAIEKLLPAFQESHIAAACGTVLPRQVKTIWERGRYIEYLFAFTFYKPIQDYFGKPLISSGCFSIYRTQVLREVGGWSNKTMAEDMDLTWTLYSKNYGVRFLPNAISYPIEPNNFSFLRKQLRRWSHGFVQNILIHWKDIMRIPYLRMAVIVAFWDATVASVIFLIAVPLFSLLYQNPIFLLAYVLDAPAILVPVLIQAKERKEMTKALISFPAFFVLRIVNGIFILQALWSEIILKKSLHTYEKGH